MAARSTTVIFVNNTNRGLRKVSEGLPHGEWTNEPPNDILAHSQVVWGSESSGVFTGTEGWVRYRNSDVNVPDPFPDSETVYVHWDNPYVGGNSYNTSALAPYIIEQQGDGSGDNATVTFSLAGASGPDTCIQGYVWRGASPNDHVCVLPETCDQAAYDNSQASVRRDPSGPFGPDTCIQGYVWREAFLGDHVCVLPETRDQAAYDNSQAASRIA